jgi:hypothetical protein
MKRIVVLLFTALIFAACSDNGGKNGPNLNDFDRKQMLSDWSDIIIASYEAYNTETTKLESAAVDFQANPTVETLNALTSQWENSYIVWQHVSMFEIGPASDVNLRNSTNIYPTDTTAIHQNVSSESINFTLPSTYDEQGFPALDFLLFGLASSPEATVDFYQKNPAYAKYIVSITDHLNDLSTTVLSEWANTYRDDFVENSENMASGSVDMFTNDFIFYYEKAFRAGKIGNPAGVFSSDALPELVEAHYHGNLSKTLTLEALVATQLFFNGQSHYTETRGESFASYLDYLNTMKEGADLSGLINTKFDEAHNYIQTLDEDYAAVVQNDKFDLIRAFDLLQQNVVLMKVDMLQALGINVDYVDADGD